ncbi:hypothetical protein M5K25_024346 [Dendrobium thyrsiflorum]|uniref:DUF4283 domain-containing protein n=1 Tax=Dendrobium thyrsiflorum TaxID=117978 RepID=A0ABD0U1Z8_DENTH
MASSRLRDPGFLSGASSAISFKDAMSGAISSSYSFPDLQLSSHRGLPALLISEEELSALAAPFEFALVVVKWSPNLDVEVDSPIVSIWISFPYLRPHLFSTRILSGLGSLFGRTLKSDTATASGSRSSVARILVELDVTKKFSDKIWVGSPNCGYVQSVIFDDILQFCTHCSSLGHSIEDYKILHPHLKSTPLPSVPSASPGVKVDAQVAASSIVVADELAGGCDVCPSALASEVLVVENIAGVGNVCDGSVTADLCVAGNRGDPVVREVPAGEHVSIGASVEGLVEPLLVNCSDKHVSSPVAGAVVPVVPEVAAPSSENFGPSVEVELPSGLPPPDHLLGQADMVYIPIFVVSNAELKSRMAWSMNNSALVQSNWLDIDDPNSTPSTADSEDFGAHVNDDMYSFMVGCVVDQAVLNGGGKKWKSKSKKK